MDPVQAWKLQRSRLGAKEKTLEELRASQPRWTVAFDMADEDEDGFISNDEACQAFKRIMGGGSEVPEYKLKELFEELDVLGRSKLEIRQFYKLAGDLSQYMTETPKWQAEEEEREEKEEKARIAAAREKKANADSDVFSILGIAKSKDMQEAASKKDEAVAASKAAAKDKLKAAGRRVLESQRLVKRMGALKALSKRATVQEPSASSTPAPKKQEDPVSPSGLVSSFTATRSAGRDLIRRATIEPSSDLPSMHHQGFGAACFALRFSPDDTQLAGGYLDGGLRIFDVDRAAHLFTMNLTPREKERQPNLESMEDGVQAQQEARERRLQTRGAAMMNLRWLPAGKKLNIIATVDVAGTTAFWEASKVGNARIVAELQGEHELNAMSFSEDGEKLLVGGQERILKIYDVQEMRESRGKGTKHTPLGSKVSPSGRVSCHTLKILSIRSLPGHNDLFVSGGMDRSLLLWDLRAPRSAVGSISGVNLSADSLEVSKDGHTLMVGNHRLDSPFTFFDLRALTEADESSKKAGVYIESAVKRYQWSGEETEKQEEATTPSCQIFQAAWDGFDNSIIAACGEKENMARIFERPKGCAEGGLRLISSLQKAKAFYSAAVSMDGRNAAFGSADGSVIISNVRST